MEDYLGFKLENNHYQLLNEQSIPFEIYFEKPKVQEKIIKKLPP